MPQHRITGTLARAAEVRVCLGGAYVLDLELEQISATDPHPIVCRRQYGHGSSAAIAAHSAATHLRQGTRVEVWCVGIAPGATATAEPAIALRGVDHINRLA